MEKDYGILIRSFTSNFNTYIGNQVEKYGIKQGQLEYFIVISQNPGITQLELAKLIKVGKSSVTQAIKILEDDGYVKKVPDENNRRSILCQITEKGEQIIDKLLQIKSAADEQLFHGFSNEDHDLFMKYLLLLNNNAERLIEK